MLNHFSKIPDPIEKKDLHTQMAQLIQHTLFYLKDPLTCQKTYFSNPEESTFFTTKTVFKEKKLALSSSNPKPPVSEFQEKSLPPPTKSKLSDPDKNEPKVFHQNSTPLLKPTQIPHHALDLKNDKTSYTEIKTILQKISPSLKMHESVLEDTQARKIKNGYKEILIDTEVVILLCDLSSEWVVFVKNLAKAIDERLAKVKVISAMNLEREKRWDLFFEKNRFRLILASDQVHTFAGLMHYHKSAQTESVQSLHNNPLLILSSPSTYTQIEQKTALWNQLCQLLKK